MLSLGGCFFGLQILTLMASGLQIPMNGAWATRFGHAFWPCVLAMRFGNAFFGLQILILMASGLQIPMNGGGVPFGKYFRTIPQI